MADSPTLRCPHCGGLVLPVDPGWTLPEVAMLLRIKPHRVASLSRELAASLSQPQYRRINDHPRLHRFWTAQDIAIMQRAIFRHRVKSLS